MTDKDAEIARCIMDLAHQRGTGKTFCPSEVARAFASEWRPWMPEVRRVAAELATAGVLRVTQKGRPVSLAEARGAIRLGLPD